METDDRLTPLAAALPATVPFVGPDHQERLRKRAYKARLGANELGFGPSPRALQAMATAAPDSWMYGDETAYDLTRGLSELHGIAAQHIRIGEGIDGLLGLIVRLMIAPGDVAVTSIGSYPTFNYHVTGFGGQIRAIPYVNDRADLPGLTQRARECGAKLVYLASPDNPMGALTPPQEIAALLDSLPPQCLLVLDEAYAEFAPAAYLPPWAPQDRRLIRLRTFSKAYGLAGLRVGYAVGPAALIASFDRVRNHFGVGRLAQAAALAALQDQTYLQQTIEKVADARQWIAQLATENSLVPLPSSTNFVTLDCGQDGAFARRVLEALDAEDIFIRMPFAAPQNRCIRVSVGPQEQMEALAAALPRALAKARA